MIKPNTQAGRLLTHFQSGGKITSLRAYDHLGITQLGARISDLQDHGYLINKRWIEVKNRFNEACHVVEYSLLGGKVTP